MSNSNIEMKLMPTNFEGLCSPSYLNYEEKDKISWEEKNPEIEMN